MKKIFVLIILLMSIALILPIQKTFAADLSSGDTVSVEKVQKNPIILSNTAKIKSDSNGDLTVMSGDAQVDGSVEDSAYVFSGKANVKSPEIGNRLIVMSGEADVNSHIKGDLIIFGGNVTLESSNVVDGDVFVFGGNLFIKGQIGGSLNCGGGKVVLDGAIIQGNLNIHSDQISISDNSRVNGQAQYFAKSQNTFPAQVFKTDPKFNETKSSGFSSSSTIIGAVLMLMILSLLIVWVQKTKAEQEVILAYDKFGSKLLTGFLISFIVPLAILVLMISYIGIFVALAIGFLYITAWFFAYAYSAIFAGAVVVKWLTKSKILKVDWSSAVFGSIVIVLISYIPIVGVLVGFVLSLVGMGIVYSNLMKLSGFKNAAKSS